MPLTDLLQGVGLEEAIEAACASSMAVWAEVKRGFENGPLHEEWYGLAREETRLALVAPREHAKSECLTVNATAWRSIYRPGTWTYVFADTIDQAETLKERIDSAVAEAEPWMMDRLETHSKRTTTYRNGSRVTVASAGKSVRGAHPDVIIGDDVLEESKCLTRLQRERTAAWWFGTVSNMAHPGVTRVLPDRSRVRMPPTKVFLVGTPFHREDLLMGMKSNPMYKFRRYAAEFDEGDLVDGLAVEVS